MTKLLLRLFLALMLISVHASAQERVRLPISASSKTLGYSPVWVAWRQGFFDKQGLDVQVVFVEGADKSVMALIGGSTFVAAGAADAMMGAVEQGLDLVAIGGVINGLTHFILGGKKFHTYEDLRGATIGSSGLASGTTFVLRRVLITEGLDFGEDYRLLGVGGAGPALAALVAGRVDAGIIAIPVG